MLDEKKTIRMEALSRRDALPEALRHEKSLRILEKVLKSEAFQQAKTVACYFSIRSEVETGELMTRALLLGKCVALPKTCGDELVFYRIDGEEPLVKSRFGVPEPDGNEEKRIDPKTIDLLIVPGVAFDEQGYRLGYGKGFYDRFLPKTDAKRIGLAFREQILSKPLPRDDFDQPVDQVITD